MDSALESLADFFCQRCAAMLWDHDYRGTKKRAVPFRSPKLERPGRMKRLNARLREDPEFAALFAVGRAARMKIINNKLSRITAEHLQQRAAAKQHIVDEIRRIDDTYAFECPNGTWTGRLEETSWRNSDLILCFTEMSTGKRYQIRRKSGDHYMPADRSHDFRHDAAPGDVFELRIKRTINGYPDLKSARKIAPRAEPLKLSLIVTVLPSRRRHIRPQSDRP